jgi:hypothetical protein
MSGLWPISRPATFVVAVTNGSLSRVGSSARETLEDVPLVVCEIHESRADFIALSARSLRNSPDFDVGGEWLTREIQTQTATRAFFGRLARLDQHTGQADVEQTHRERDRENRPFSTDHVKSRRSSSFFGQEFYK